MNLTQCCVDVFCVFVRCMGHAIYFIVIFVIVMTTTQSISLTCVLRCVGHVYYNHVMWMLRNKMESMLKQRWYNRDFSPNHALELLSRSNELSMRSSEVITQKTLHAQ